MVLDSCCIRIKKVVRTLIDKKRIVRLDDYFKRLDERTESGIYFSRVNEYSGDVEGFLIEFMKRTKGKGVCIDQKMRNPDENQIRYYEDMIGKSFALDRTFIEKSIRVWLGGLNDLQYQNLSESMNYVLLQIRASGKSENIIKNAFIKFMCWFYYKFKPIMNKLGNKDLPKILYAGEISIYELYVLKLLAGAGCDVLLINYGGEDLYKKADAGGDASDRYRIEGEGAFPENFSLTALRKIVEEQTYLENLYRQDDIRIAGTNTWISTDPILDSLKTSAERGAAENLFCNMFVKISGVEDKASYCKELFHWKNEMENKGKTVFILEKITPPTVEEVAKVRPGNYADFLQMMADLTAKIKCPFEKLRNQAKKAFIENMSEERQLEKEHMNRLKTKAIYLVCWFGRYGRHLFKQESCENLPALVYFGTCRNTAEVLLLKFFASLPVDVIVMNPNLQNSCILSDSRLFERKYENSLEIEKFPVKVDDVRYGTVAYHAEQDLNTILYQDSGLYRSQQYKKAISVTLQTMYEEVYMLWNQEVTLRPNFEIIDGKVVIPAIISKISGVKDSDVNAYWKDVKKLLEEECLFVSHANFWHQPEENMNWSSVISNRVVQKGSIVRKRNYQYGIFREEIQEYILEKLQELLDSELIRGTFTGGVENVIINVVMNLDKKITRLIQKMDFTKDLPKMVLVNTGEAEYTLEDSIVLAYLHLIGFDIALFVPTGYRLIERHYTKPLFTEHHIGEFMYDLKIPGYIQGRESCEQVQQEGFFRRLLKKDR